MTNDNVPNAMDREEYRWFRDKLHGLILEGARTKSSTLPVISGLLLAILAIGSSGDLFEVNTTVKFIATALLLLTVLSVQVYYSDAVALSINASKALDKHAGIESSNTELTVMSSLVYLFTGKINGKKSDNDFFDRLTSQLPAYCLLILWWIVFLIIWEIWNN